MPKIFKKLKVSATGLGDLIAAGFIKRGEETLLAPIVGNGTFISGAVKAGAAMMVSGRSKTRKIAAMALGIDAGEDFANAIINLVMGGGGGGGLGGLGGGGNAGGDF